MPAQPKQDLSQWKNTILLHNGHRHDLEKVLQLAATGPTITVDLVDVGPVVDNDAPPANLFLYQPKSSEINQLSLVLYKHQGRFHVLAGEAEVTRAKTNKLTQVTGRLLSTPTLKKARIIDAEEVVPAPAPFQRTPAPIRNGFNRPKY